VATDLQVERRRAHCYEAFTMRTSLMQSGHTDDSRGKGQAQASQASSSSHPSAAMTPLKTYIVEDSPVIRENLIATLEEMVSLQVVGTAEDETTATYWLNRRDNACDLVIIDIFLKGGSGLGVLQAARAAAAAHCKLVVLSNYATPDMRRKCLELGADKVFDKSNEIDALISYCIRLANGGETGNSSFSSLA
jgi:DNA-binding NarL/FixJ family response regulator